MLRILLSVLLFSILSGPLSAQNFPVKKQYKNRWDSLKAVAAMMKAEQAQKRFLSLQSNTRKDTVKVVDLSNLKLNEFPELALEFPNMTTLDISANSFVKIPSALKKMDSLKTIIWTNIVVDKSGNKTELKLRFPGKLTVEKLYLKDMQLANLPRSVKRLKMLEQLVLSNNNLQSLNGRLKKLRALTVLNLDENPIAVHEVKWHKIPSSVEMLKLNKCGLTEIPEEIYQLKVKDLQFRENMIAAIPEGISRMDSLRKLSFYKNELVALPKDFYDLKLIRSLDLYYNQLSSISPKIASFDSLSVLYLAHNKLYEVPAEIGRMQQLEELYLHHNQISFLPESFANLVSLKTLRLNDNILPEFPMAIISMRELEFLDVSSNLLETIPEKLSLLTNLKLFSFDKNQIDLQSAANRHIAPMISDMTENGVVCDPSIRKEVVSADQ